MLQCALRGAIGALEPGTNSKFETIVSRHKRLFVLTLAQVALLMISLFLLVYATATSNIYPMKFIIAAPFLLGYLLQIASSFVVYRVASNMFGNAIGLVLAVATPTVFLGYVVQLWLFYAAGDALARAGYRVTALGVENEERAS